MFGSVRQLNDGTSVRADAGYVRESLMEPNKKVVKGFQVAMGSYAGILSDVEIDSVIMFIKELK